MCGEHPSGLPPPMTHRGSSPHVRGARLCGSDTGGARWDHPRMCGEHIYAAQFEARNEGSSPHVRGAPLVCLPVAPGGGIIPACAGSTRADPGAGRGDRDHPRMCGEHNISQLPASSPQGSSPHVRGAPCSRAGLDSTSGDHPRMCGEHQSRRRRRSR